MSARANRVLWVEGSPKGDDALASQLTQAYLDEVGGEVERVRSFDRLVVSSPMWNWNVPHALKAWIDIVVQPVASFTLNCSSF